MLGIAPSLECYRPAQVRKNHHTNAHAVHGSRETDRQPRVARDTARMGDLSGQVGIVTGAGRGIGRAVAVRLASMGMAVALVARTPDQLDETASECEAAGGHAIPLAFDVVDASAFESAVADIEARLGPTDLLVSNAGTPGPETPLWEAGYDAWWRPVQVNLGGAMAGASAVLRGMVARNRGRLVHMNSLVGTRDDPQYGSYAVSKAAMFRLGGTLAASLAGTGVVVIDVSPGLVHTAIADAIPMFADVPDEDWTPPDKVASLVADIARGRYDALSGRFIHANDDPEQLLDRIDEIVANDGRALRLRRGWDADPLFP